MSLSWVSHGNLIYTSEVILCYTICVHNATRHNIYMYPYSLRRDSPPKSSPISVSLSWVSHGNLIYTSEAILCSTICVYSATQYNIHMYPYSLRRDSPPKSSPTFSVRSRSSVGRVTVDLIRRAIGRSWVRLPPRSKEFFFTLCGSLIHFTRANAPWLFHGLT